MHQAKLTRLACPPLQDEWLGGMRKTITIEFYKDTELVGKSESLPGDRIRDAAAKANVPIGDEVRDQGPGCMERGMGFSCARCQQATTRV